MPALSALFAGTEQASTTSATFVAAAETAALADGVPYLVLGTANGNSNASNTTLEIETTFGGTRYAFGRYRLGSTGAPDAATGGHVATAFVVTGDGASTVATRHQRVNGTGNVRTTAHLAAIPLDSLTENTHYWRAEGPNSDTLTNPAAGAGWVGSGQQVDVTPAATGQFLVIACLEAEFTSGHTSDDLARMRCRVTEDPAGSPTSYNLQRNEVADPDIEGPEHRIEGGAGWGSYAHGVRFLDVVTLAAGTTYRFEPEYEGVAGTANTGYRRARVIVLDLSVWPEFASSRDVDGQASQDVNFATASATAPSQATDYLLLGAVAYSNNNSWIRTRFDVDPGGAGSILPASSGFGIALTDNGNTLTDDYGQIGLQWHRSAISAAQDVAVNCVADLQVCRFGHVHGDFPGAVDDGVATPLVIWGMETSVAGGGTGELSGSASGTSTADGSLTATGALSGSSAGTSTARAQNTPFSPTGVVAFIGNSYTQNFNGLDNLLEYYVGQRLGQTPDLGPPPDLPTTISSFEDGWYPGMSLGGMALYPTIDQSQVSGTTDAVDAVLDASAPAYDHVVLTSGFRQESSPGDADVADDTAVVREVLTGAGGTNPNVYGVCLEVTRRIATELAGGGHAGGLVCRMTHEGFNANDYADLDTVERIVRLQVLGARQLLAEGVVDYVVPDHYVWSRLQWGAFGTVGSGQSSPVAAYSALTHSLSQQPGDANLAWLNRTQNGSAPFTLNGHQNALAMIVQAWIWGYAMYGIDPRGDTTFQGDPSGLPAPFDVLIAPDGSTIYGGHNTGAGADPYPSPPDSESVYDWSPTTQAQIQALVVAAVDDFNAEQTEFDAAADSAMSGTAGGSSTTSGTLNGTGALQGTSQGSSTASGDLEGGSASGGTAAGTSSAAGTLTGTGALQGSAAGSATASGTLEGLSPNALRGSAAGTSTASATLSGTGALAGTSAGSSAAQLTNLQAPPITGALELANTVRPMALAGTTRPMSTPAAPWYVNPEDEGSTLRERVQYPAITTRRVVTTIAGPVDLGDVVSVGVEVWDSDTRTWFAVAGVGAVETVDEADANGVQQTWYELTFAPGDGALQAVEDTLGRRGSHPRRWVLGMAGGGDLHVPSSGYGVIHLNELPS